MRSLVSDHKSYQMCVVALVLLAAAGCEFRQKRSADVLQDSGSPHFEARLDSGGISLLEEGQNVLRYQIAFHMPPDSVDPVFGRNAFLHPVWSPSGDTLSRINPPDHWHHYGIWNPWTRTQIGSRNVDFWNLGERQGTVRHRSVDSLWSGEHSAGFIVSHDHVGFGPTNEELVLIHEAWTVELLEPAFETERDHYVWEMTVQLTPATADTVILEAYRYGGGIGFRATEDWTKKNSWVLTSEGETRETADGTSARWVITGGRSSAGRTSSLIFASHPDNHAHPEPMRVWPADANGGRGDMFFEFCPIRHEAWTLFPDHTYTLKYQVVVSDGDADSKFAESCWQLFVG